MGATMEPLRHSVGNSACLDITGTLPPQIAHQATKTVNSGLWCAVLSKGLIVIKGLSSSFKQPLL